jgi:transcription elongation factor Elf1
MRGITLTEDFITQIVGKPAVKISESQEGGEQTEKHVCPLCESHLEEPISEEKIQEHVDYFLDVINENFDIVGDDLDETEEVEEEADEEAEGEEESDEELEG